MQCDHRRQQDDFSSPLDNLTSSSSTLDSEQSESSFDLAEAEGNRIAVPSDVCSVWYTDFPIIWRR